MAHLDMSVPQAGRSEALSVLRINRNAVLICDGDRREEEGALKNRVVRACEALEGAGGLCWVTKCKEIENYIPKEVFSIINGLGAVEDIEPYENIIDYLRKHGATGASIYTDKVVKAKLYAELFTRQNLSFRPEVDEYMGKICARIMLWNSMAHSGVGLSRENVFEMAEKNN